ncbi:serine hydrolase domain-containing protein [Flavobacterium sp. LB2P84]|uniref:Serine hydrolase domain-containing protein n=1 Tax=Flavobacterium yafengii TaxID=3041253 RepID=A0AAW6TLA1_9FLAO|nr:serine hydrolase domain-containing protein [Flavobacterium yafengii]MDI5950365.1 serine hydrolase domain-containing protein [Flavobacterium yafengii]MDI6033728.1 serine hydrolase domain-containing protein [Flavobacterium yafengii]
MKKFIMKKFIITSIITFTITICFSQTFNNQRLDSLFQTLEKNNKFMGSIAVSKNGKLLYLKSIGYSDVENSKKADDKTKYRVGSISKMFTASLILKAIEENKISLSQSLDKFFPEIENSKKITIQNLLNHRSGIHDITNDKSYFSYNTEPKSEKQMIEIIAKTKSDFEPNIKVEYSNSNYIILSYILEKIYKKSYATILNSKIIKPLGLKNTYFGGKIKILNNESYSYHFTNKWDKGTETDLSIPMGAGSIQSNSTDLNTFIEQLFNGKLISQKSLSLMTTMSDFHGMGVGMGMLEFRNFEEKSYGHNGAIDDFQSISSYFPKEKLSITLTSNGLIYPINNVLSCAMSCYFNKPFAMPNFNYVELKSEILDLYLGQYTSKQIPIKINITKKENKLLGQVIGQPSFPLEATAINAFKFEQAGLVLEFNTDKKEMVLKQGGQEFLFAKE